MVARDRKSDVLAGYDLYWKVIELEQEACIALHALWHSGDPAAYEKAYRQFLQALGELRDWGERMALSRHDLPDFEDIKLRAMAAGIKMAQDAMALPPKADQPDHANPILDESGLGSGAGMPLVSVGPSGVGGYAQSEIGGAA